MNFLMREALNNRRRALQPEMAADLAAAGICSDATVLLGLDSVVVSHGIYETAKHGSAAVILPAFRSTTDRRELYDLVAIGLHSRRAATRCGNAQMLGDEWIEAAFAHDRPVVVYLDGLRWLASGCRGVFIIDLSIAPFVLGDAPGIACSDEVTLSRLHDAMTKPVRVPPFYVPEVHHVEA